MKMLKINSQDLWNYPFGTEVVLSSDLIEEYELEGNYSYAFEEQCGSTLYNGFGNSITIEDGDDYEITILIPDLNTLVLNYISSLTFRLISLTEEPFLNEREIKVNQETLKQMKNLYEILKDENGNI